MNSPDETEEFASDMNNDMAVLGWTEFFQERFELLPEQSLTPARVAREDRGAYLVLSRHGETMAVVTGKFRHDALSRADYPAVGDWVAVDFQPSAPALIHHVLPRKSRFSRKIAGGQTQEQVSAANVDIVFLISGLDYDFNPRRIERYVTLAYESGAAPVIILNKADLCPDPQSAVAEVESVACAVPVHAVSAVLGTGLDQLAQYLAAGKTVVMLGSSGVGKSSLINAFLGQERMSVGPVREHDSHGRHTTTHRELICLPGGGMMIDTPGLRELQLWSDQDGLRSAFQDIDELSQQCRFRDCAHLAEPGCAVRGAVERGVLAAERLENYRRLEREVVRLEKRLSRRERIAARRGARRQEPRKKFTYGEEDMD